MKLKQLESEINWFFAIRMTCLNNLEILQLIENTVAIWYIYIFSFHHSNCLPSEPNSCV
jgi:hypothetical protein